MDRKIPPRKKYIRYLKRGLGILIFFVFLVVVRKLVVNSLNTATFSEATIRTAEAEVKDLIISFTVEGRVIPQETYQVEAPVGGKVETILVRIGDLVSIGDTLVVLVNDDLQLQLINSETETANQINNLSTARIQNNQSSIAHKRLLFALERQILKEKRALRALEQLYQNNLVSEDEYLTKVEELEILQYNYKLSSEEAVIDSLMRKQQITQIEQSLTQVQHNLEQMRNKVYDLVIKSPIYGQVTQLNLTTGQILAPGSSIAFIENNFDFYVQARINQHYSRHLEVGANARVIDQKDSFFLSIDNIQPRLEGDNLVVEFTGDLPSTVRSGQSLNLEIQTSVIKDALTIPLGLYLSENEFLSVFVLDEKEKIATRRFIKTGGRNFREIEIKEGLKEGEEIIISSNPAWRNKNVLKIR